MISKYLTTKVAFLVLIKSQVLLNEGIVLQLNWG